MTTSTSVISRRSNGYLLGMTIPMFGANFVWVSYNSILLLPLVQKVAPAEHSSITVGIIAFVANLVGIVVSILFGILSDHSASRFGRRTPSILIGTLVGLPVIACGAIFHLSLPVIIVSYLGMQIFTNIANGAWWPLLVDTVSDDQRGLASGLQGFYMLLASAISFMVVTYLNEINRPDIALLLMAGIFALTGLICTRAIRPYDKPAASSRTLSLSDAITGMFRVRTRVAVFFWLVFSGFLINMGLNSLQYLARDFLGIYFGLANPDAGLRLVGLINLVVIMLAAVGTGLLSDKIGRRKLIVAGAIISALTTFGMVLTRDFTVFLILTVVRAVATGPIMAVIPALASGLAPQEEAGQYMAYNNMTTALPSAFAPLLFGAILNLGGASTPASFVTLLIISAGFYMLGGIVFGLNVSQKALGENIR
ncbi:MAG: MFS transporter [Anaerolineales bacterium]|nr:MFS transporter [Anaerolineales bacterium]